MIKLYGIPNCDTMKKARKYLADHGVAYEFHDYKKLGIEESLLQDWIKQAGWETLLNRRGMMWRKLSQEQRDSIDEPSAVQLMLETPSIIKRPVLIDGKNILVGFKESDYEKLI